MRDAANLAAGRAENPRMKRKPELSIELKLL
jgi:hypothetical protein